MPKRQKHIIRKQVIELSLPRVNGSLQLQKKISQAFNNYVVKELDEIFDDITPNGETAQLGRLEIDLGEIPLENLENAFINGCLSKINNDLWWKIENVKAVNKDAAKPSKQQFYGDEIDAFFYFLTIGTLPWYVRHNYIHEWEAILSPLLPQNTNRFQNLLKKAIHQNRVSMERLIQQFSTSFVSRVLTELFGFSAGDQQNLVTNIQSLTVEKLAKNDRITLQKAILHSCINGQIPNPQDYNIHILVAKLKEYYKSNEQLHIDLLKQSAYKQIFEDADLSIQNLIKSLSIKTKQTNSIENKNGEKSDNIYNSPTTDTSVSRQQDEPPDKLYIENAGLVICAYFLKPFFEGLGLVNKGSFVNPMAQQKAVLLSQYLVNGINDFPEFLLPLNKILCGMPLEETLNSQLEILEQDKDEAQNLLEQIIKHWNFLGNTSVEGLRNTFLKRKGILNYEPNTFCWMLNVEKQAYDICLDHLPWTISVIKLPWMKDRLIVEWV